MDRPVTKRHCVRDALFLDIPYIVDSIYRHADYSLNRLHDYVVGEKPRLRPYPTLPPFAFFLMVLMFSAYGATLSSLCGVLAASTVEILRYALGVVCVIGAVVQFFVSASYLNGRIARRFERAEVDDKARRRFVHVVFWLVLFGAATPLYFYGRSLMDASAFDRCRPNTQAWPAQVQLAATIVVGLITAFATFKESRTGGRIFYQVVLLACIVIGLWNLPDITTRTEAAQVPYPHLYAVIVLGMAAVALGSIWFIWLPFYSIRDQDCTPFRDALASHELFPESRRDPELSSRRIFGGGVIGILHQPLQFLLLPSFAIIFVPTGFLWHACIIGTLASLMLVIAANLTTRWDNMSEYLRRYFMLGTPLVVSLAVIVIAMLRLAEVQYVATVLNVAPFGVLFAWMIMAYVLVWWFEYQVNRVLAVELLSIFAPKRSKENSFVDYPLDANHHGPVTRVELTDRYLATHATGQFIVLGWFTDNKTKERVTAFHTYSFIELFTKLLGEDNPDAVHEIGRRVQLYFALVNVLLAIGFGVLFWHVGLADRDNTAAPVVTAHAGPSDHEVDLKNLLAKDNDHGAPAIVVAASGGGTRAAIYAASVLQGLHALKVDQNVVLLSGVSGGGVAAAYFYGHRAALLTGKPQLCDALDQKLDDPWSCFRERMAMPFIRDVLQGAGEWRIQSNQPLGILLTESFERRLFNDGKSTFGDNPDIGLILNTTMTGHPIEEEPTLNGALAELPHAPELSCDIHERPVSGLAGGRLAFANLANVSAFSRMDPSMPNIQLPFVVIRDEGVELAKASALNANFPPVFPNARVNLTNEASNGAGCPTRSYYVTDGGATENLGLLSALLALKSTLTELKDKGNHPRIRDIDIVLAEASAMDYDYEQDRGVGAATGQSKERLTGRLTLELMDELTRLLADIDPQATINVHDFSLPRVFRSRGGFGTHWMFPEYIRLNNPLESPVPKTWKRIVAQYSRSEREWVTVDKDELFKLWAGLYDVSTDFCELKWPCDHDDDLKSVSNWICGHDAAGAISRRRDPQLDAWQKFVAETNKRP